MGGSGRVGRVRANVGLALVRGRVARKSPGALEFHIVTPDVLA